MTSATGLIDAVSHPGWGQVFVANMTGNVVLLGFALSDASVAVHGDGRPDGPGGGRATAALTGAIGPVGSSGLGLLAVLGVAMGMQNATARRLAIRDLTTRAASGIRAFRLAPPRDGGWSRWPDEPPA